MLSKVTLLYKIYYVLTTIHEEVCAHLLFNLCCFLTVQSGLSDIPSEVERWEGTFCGDPICRFDPYRSATLE